MPQPGPELELGWKDYAQAFADVIEALSRVSGFLRSHHFTVRDLFRACDVNHSGSVSREELVLNFLRLGLPITYGQVRRGRARGRGRSGAFHWGGACISMVDACLIGWEAACSSSD
jgi:hypothetical protein